MNRGLTGPHNNPLNKLSSPNLVSQKRRVADSMMIENHKAPSKERTSSLEREEEIATTTTTCGKLKEAACSNTLVTIVLNVLFATRITMNQKIANIDAEDAKFPTILTEIVGSKTKETRLKLSSQRKVMRNTYSMLV